MYFSLNDGLEARAATVLRADGALLVGSETGGLLVGETSSQQVIDFAEASEELSDSCSSTPPTALYWPTAHSFAA